ncbi:MAG: TOBE domain-containing protein [Methanomicrobiales archaeon]|nr:TOBE domain-containing protein [Methanomicrobiales archaeon]
MKISARNALKGTVKSITTGPINAEILIDIGGGNLITSIITHKSVDSLGLTEGKSVYAIVKASEVLVAVD